jgi:signal transduction histidine kinase
MPTVRRRLDALAAREVYHRRMSERTALVSRARLADLGDVAMAIVLTLFAWAQVAARPFVGGRGFPMPFPMGRGMGMAMGQFRVEASPLTYLLIGVAFLPLAFRRRLPVTVLMLTTAAAALYEVTANPPSFTTVGVLIALYTVGAFSDRRRLLLSGAVAGALLLAASLPDLSSDLFTADVVRNIAVIAAAGLLGDATRSRRAYVAEVERRAAEAERTREEEARRRVDEERLRIARELHDVTAHSLAVIAVQSGAAAHVLDSDPAEARRSLVAIRDTSRNALQELRAMLGVLRGSEDESAPLAPAAGLARLVDLVRPLEEAGLSVEVVSEGALGDVPALVDSSAYRIVQEALTNVLRHVGKGHVTVVVRREGDALSLEVLDDGPATGASEEGHGIAGMRERAQALGGTFETGPLEGGGWRVAARLPVTGRPV